jgi:CelD/BcsL family acetyltransferase involved in cellulose biosynthesis
MLMLDRQSAVPDVTLDVAPEFDFLSDEYRDLYARSGATAFQAPLWMSMLHRSLAPRLSAKQHTITARRIVDGHLVAVMPFVIQRTSGVSMVLPADFGLCDYNALVADEATLNKMACSSEHLASIAKLVGKADLVMFRKVRADGFDVSRLFPKGTMTIGDHAAYRCEFGPDFEAWRRTLSKSISNRLPRQHRQVEQQFGSYEHRCVRDELGIRDAFAFLRRVREGLFEEDLLDDPLYYEFYLQYAIASASSGEAALYVGYITGEPVSFLFGLVGGRHFHAVQLGTDRNRYGKYSVGNQVYYHTMQDQFHSGQRVLDMGIGDTGYKSDFRAIETPMRNFTSAKTIRGAAVAAVYHHAKPLKNMLRRLTPRLH